MMRRRGSSITTGEIIVYQEVSQKYMNNEDIELKSELVEGSQNVAKLGKRHIEVFACFLMFLINQLMRQHMSITVVAMTDPHSNKNTDIPTFHWTNVHVILSSFFWGYIIPQFVAGVLITRFGPKWFMIGSTAITGGIGWLIPWFAIHYGSTAVIACRVVQGFAQAVIVPSVSCFMSRWIPISERGRSGTFILSAISVGTVTGMPLAGALAASSYGWPMTFYVLGSLAIAWSVTYTFIGYNSPGQHKLMSEEEKAFIIQTSVDPTKKIQEIPWKCILLSLPFWAYFYSYTCYILISWVFLTEIPTYMNKILLFNINSNGMLTAVVYIVQWVFSLLMSVITDYVINKNYWSITTARKFFSIMGLGTPAIGCIFLAQCTSENYTRAIFLLMLSAGSLGAIFGSLQINILDIAPNHAGSLQGFVNGLSHIVAILAPLLVHFMVDDEHNPEQWKKVFYLSGAVSASGAIIFGLMGTGEVQSWNNLDKNEEEEA